MKKGMIRLLKNKYALASVVFVFWIMFVNDIDVFYIIRSRMELVALTEEAERMKEKNIQARQSLHDLTTNVGTLEKFARERYYMKRDNEEVFVFKERSE
ncbi:MAG: FtsB family cell division protein [Flavobacteriales bacterium]|jgi:cell division protein FtsB